MEKHPHGGGETVNKIVAINIDAARYLDLDAFYRENEEGFRLIDKAGFTELIPIDSVSQVSKTVLRIILRLLLDKKTVIFNPTTLEGYNSSLYDKLVTNLNSFYKNTDLVFHPQHVVSVRRSTFYKPKIDMHQVILFKPEDRLIDFLSMQLSLEDLSVFINQGSYEFMSLVRIAYILKPKVPREVALSANQRGGEDVHLPPSFVEDAMKEYSHTFETTLTSLKKNTLTSVKKGIKNIGQKISKKKGAKKKGKQTKHKRK